MVMDEHDDDISDAEIEPKLFKGIIGDNDKNDEGDNNNYCEKRITMTIIMMNKYYHSPTS
jgi:hypothetical protein